MLLEERCQYLKLAQAGGKVKASNLGGFSCSWDDWGGAFRSGKSTPGARQWDRFGDTLGGFGWAVLGQVAPDPTGEAGLRVWHRRVYAPTPTPSPVHLGLEFIPEHLFPELKGTGPLGGGA